MILRFTYDELTPDMPGEFLITTVRGSRYIVVNGPGPTNAFCRIVGVMAPKAYGDGEWVWCGYERLAIGQQGTFYYARDERDRPFPPRYFATLRITDVITEITMYLGTPEPPSDIWESPWWDVAA